MYSNLNTFPIRRATTLIPPDQTVFRSGIAELNQALGGGFRRGEATLIGGRTGGGKTILACQFAYEFGASGAKTAMISTERGDLTPRFIANATSTDVGLVRPNTEAEYDAIMESLNTNPRTKNAMARLKQVLNNVSLIDGYRGNYTPMARIMDSAQNAMRQISFVPDVLIYDWLGDNEIRGAGNAFDVRRRYKESADTFARFCARNNVAGIIFCQLAQRYVGHKTTSINSCMVAECKDLMEHMAAFVGISYVREHGGPARRQYLSVELKNGPTRNVPVERQFEFQRFAGVEGGL